MVNDVYFKITHILGHYTAHLSSLSDPRERSLYLSLLMTLTQPCKPHQSFALVLYRKSVNGTREIYLCQIPLNAISHSV